MTSKYLSVNNLKVSEELLNFVNNQLFKGTDISPEKFWKDFDEAVHELAPKNKELINFREILQKKILLLLLEQCMRKVIKKIVFMIRHL